MKRLRISSRKGVDGRSRTFLVDEQSGELRCMCYAPCRQGVEPGESNAFATSLAAGWNLLETLEGMRVSPVDYLSLVIDRMERRGSNAAPMREIFNAIRTALESKP